MSMDLQFASVRAVFGNDYLREKILDLVVHHDYDDRTIDRKSLVYLRQVQKSWRTTIDHRLHHLKEPLFIVKLDENNSLNGTPFVEANGKALDRFTAFLAGRDDTFRLKLWEAFFRLENYDSLSNLFQRCSQGLVALELEIPKNVGSFPGIFPTEGLPNLQKLWVTLTSKELANSTSIAPGNTTTLLATILLQSPNLKKWWISAHYPDSNRSFVCPPGFGYLVLPSSLEKLVLKCPVRCEDLHFLKRSPLAALTELELKVTASFPEGTLFNILNGIKSTLKDFNLKGCLEWRNTQSLIKFPEMKKLEKLSIYSFNAELDKSTKANLNACFPKLKRLHLRAMSSKSLASWTEGQKLEAVTALSVSLFEEQETDLENDERLRIVPTPTLLEKVLQTMPNVTTLSLEVDGRFVEDFSCLFEKLGGITSLSITMVTSDPVENSDVWDSLLTGLPLEITKAFRLNPTLEDNFEMEVKNETSLSIRQLKKLTTLSLATLWIWSYSGAKSMLSRVAFKHAFLQMPALKTLTLKQRFKVSQDIVEEWEQSGRVLIQD